MNTSGSSPSDRGGDEVDAVATIDVALIPSGS
jgi:hypothetical protein